MERYRIAILIPAYNEEQSIGKVIKLSSKYGSVIVVDDGSTDSTTENSKSAGAIVIKHPQNEGYDKALQSGYNYTFEKKFNFLIVLDADGQHNPNEIDKFIEELENGASVVIGRRNKKQRFMEHFFSWITKLRWGISDPLCGMKAYNLELINNLNCFQTNYSIGTNVMIYCLKNKLSVKEVQINENSRKGVSRFGTTIKSNFKILIALVLSL